MRLVFAALLMPRIGADAIWWSFPVSFGAAMVMALAFYRFGRWRQRGLIRPMGAQEAEEHALAGSDSCGKLTPAN